MSHSKRWLKEHFSDHYVKQAQKHGYPSRAAYKLLELQEKYHLLHKNMRVVDLGAAPGGWSLVAAEIVGEKGQVFAVDRLPMTAISGVVFIQGDFSEETVFNELMTCLEGKKVDLVISDMAPNISGDSCTDQARSIYLVELAWDCTRRILKPGGHFLAKIFQGEGVDQLIKSLRTDFRKVNLVKPKASRPRSREVYVLAREFLGYNEK